MALGTEDWLVWLGVKEPQVDLSEMRADVDRLKDSVGDWSAFETLVSNQTSYAEYEQALLDAGFPSDKVDAHISRVQDTYSGWSAYQDDVVNTLNSYEEYQSQFGNQSGMTGSELTEDGEPTAGIRVHDQSGVSYAGVSVPAGTTEIFGRRIEFSQQDAAADPSDVTYANQSTDDADNVVTVYQSMTISADVSNPNGWGVDVTVPLQEDGTVTQQETIRLGANATETVSFTLTKQDYVCVDAAIGTLDPITMCWVPQGLVV